MSYWSLLKDKQVPIGIMLLSTLFTGLFLYALGINTAGVLFVGFLILLSTFVSTLFEYLQKRRFYTMLKQNLQHLDQKTLLGEMLDEPQFQEGRLCYQALRESNKSMNDEISKYKSSAKEFREYVELWMHEVKTPVATVRLMIENHPTPEMLELEKEVDKIDEFLEQALFYSRSNTVEKDYSIARLNLRRVVNGVVKKNARTLIAKGIRIQVEGEAEVLSDEKWVQFILNQIVGNAIKYMDKPEAELRFIMEDGQNQAFLRIQDNGIGIPLQDVDRVFDKGFTGTNGRIHRKSTGIGLYLCKKLCQKLGLGISLESRKGEGTTVTIVFPKGSLTQM